MVSSVEYSIYQGQELLWVAAFLCNMKKLNYEVSSRNGFLQTKERLAHKTLGPRVQKSWILLNSLLGNQFFPLSFMYSEERTYILHQDVLRAFIKVKMICSSISRQQGRLNLAHFFFPLSTTVSYSLKIPLTILILYQTSHLFRRDQASKHLFPKSFNKRPVEYHGL